MFDMEFRIFSHLLSLIGIFKSNFIFMYYNASLGACGLFLLFTIVLIRNLTWKTTCFSY